MKDGAKTTPTSLEILPKKNNNTEITLRLTWNKISKMTTLKRSLMSNTLPQLVNSIQLSMTLLTIPQLTTLMKTMTTLLSKRSSNLNIECMQLIGILMQGKIKE